MAAKTKQANPIVNELTEQLNTALSDLAACQERERRALADYQNLLKQQQQQRANLVKLANADLAMAILEPLEHLTLVDQQLQDPALTMVVKQLWKKLNEIGLERLEVLGKQFDLDTMEVVEKTGSAKKVVKVLCHAYQLNGQLIQHAQVVLG